MEHEKITVTIPSEILPVVAKRKKDVPSKVLEYLILELYRLGELSSGKAAQYLEMDRFEFVRFASRHGISFFEMDKEELLQDYRQAHRMATRTRK